MRKEWLVGVLLLLCIPVAYAVSTQEYSVSLTIGSICNDSDNDGYNMTIDGDTCGPEDCDDNNATIHPLFNNSNEYINNDALICYGTYSDTHVIINSSNIYFDCNGSTLDGVDDSGYGIDISNRNNTIVSNCVVVNYFRGVSLSSSASNNTIYNNNLTSNTINAWDDDTNYWNTTQQTGPNIIGGQDIGGNYYDDYVGYDLDSDGIGESPPNYSISGSGGAYDYLPLTNNEPPPLTVHLMFPPHNSHVTDNTTTHTFNFTSGTNSTANCTLYYNSTSYGNNLTTLNITATNITANPEVPEGIYSWWVNCTDGLQEAQSEVWTIYINIPAVGLLYGIYIMFVILSMCIFIVGGLYAKITEGKAFMLMLAMPFLSLTSLYSFNILRVGVSGDNVITTQYVYAPIGALFGFFVLLDIALVIFLIFGITGEVIDKGYGKRR